MTTAMATYEPAGALDFTRDQLDLMKLTVAKGTDDLQFRLFIEVAKLRRLNPLTRQIYAIIRNTKDGDHWVPTMTIQTGIDGFRLIAQRTRDYAGQRGPFWCGPDGEWRDVWLNKEPPSAAKVGILRHGFVAPVWGVATMLSYMQTSKDGGAQGLWRSMPDVLIAKCAEGLALRKAFPEETGDMYLDVEMDQADNPPPSYEHEEKRPPVKTPQRRSVASLREEADTIEPADSPPAGTASAGVAISSAPAAPAQSSLVLGAPDWWPALIAAVTEPAEDEALSTILQPFRFPAGDKAALIDAVEAWMGKIKGRHIGVLIAQRNALAAELDRTA
jgi:phage recombination protein Bet